MRSWYASASMLANDMVEIYLNPFKTNQLITPGASASQFRPLTRQTVEHHRDHGVARLTRAGTVDAYSVMPRGFVCRIVQCDSKELLHHAVLRECDVWAV